MSSDKNNKSYLLKCSIFSLDNNSSFISKLKSYNETNSNVNSNNNIIIEKYNEILELEIFDNSSIPIAIDMYNINFFIILFYY